MLEATERLPIDVFFMLPSCVPSTPLDEAGAELDWFAIDRFYAHPRVLGLAEMMNYVGVCAADEAVLAARGRAAARQAHRRPPRRGFPAAIYRPMRRRASVPTTSALPSTTREKLRAGQYIAIRDGTAAKNFEALVDPAQAAGRGALYALHGRQAPHRPAEAGAHRLYHQKAIARGVDPITAVTAATRNPAEYFGLTGMARSRRATGPTFAIIDSFEHFEVQTVLKDGRVTYETARSVLSRPRSRRGS